MKYTLQELVMLAAMLEPVMIKIGCHVAIGGSCVFSGGSDKDMDVFIYPHHDPVERDNIWNELLNLGFKAAPKRQEKEPAQPPLQDLSWTAFTKAACDTTEYLPDVWKAKDVKGRVIDFFFLCRPPKKEQSCSASEPTSST